MSSIPSSIALESVKLRRSFTVSLDFYVKTSEFKHMARDYLFTSESVSEGHPDKVSDQISDAIVDAMIVQDPKSRIACETLVTTGLAVIAGEVTTEADVDLESIVRETINTTIWYYAYENTNNFVS